jgi:hypothetical protein
VSDLAIVMRDSLTLFLVLLSLGCAPSAPKNIFYAGTEEQIRAAFDNKDARCPSFSAIVGRYISVDSTIILSIDSVSYTRGQYYKIKGSDTLRGQLNYLGGPFGCIWWDPTTAKVELDLPNHYLHEELYFSQVNGELIATTAKDHRIFDRLDTSSASKLRRLPTYPFSRSN